MEQLKSHFGLAQSVYKVKATSSAHPAQQLINSMDVDVSAAINTQPSSPAPSAAASATANREQEFSSSTVAPTLSFSNIMELDNTTSIAQPSSSATSSTNAVNKAPKNSFPSSTSSSTPGTATNVSTTPLPNIETDSQATDIISLSELSPIASPSKAPEAPRSPASTPPTANPPTVDLTLEQDFITPPKKVKRKDPTQTPPEDSPTRASPKTSKRKSINGNLSSPPCTRKFVVDKFGMPSALRNCLMYRISESTIIDYII